MMRETGNDVVAEDVADQILTEIVDGTLGLGAQLPDIHELAAKISASTHTIHHGLRLLAQEGFVHLIVDGPPLIVSRTPHRFTQRVADALRSRKPLDISDAAALELLLQEVKRGARSGGERAER